MAWYETKKGGTARITEKTATGEIATFTTVIGGLPMKSCAVGIQGYQEGTGDPTPVNKRPIITFTGATARRTGKNLIKYPYYSPDGTYGGLSVSTQSDGKVMCSGTTTLTLTWYMAYGIKLIAGTYTISVRGNHTGVRLYVRNVSTSTNITTIGSDSEDATASFTLSEDADNVNIYYNCATNTAVDISSYVQLESGSEATAYAPFTGNDTYSIGWKTEAGEVYSGTIDFATGVLTVTHGYGVYSGSDVMLVGESSFGVRYARMTTLNDACRDGSIISSHYKPTIDAKTDNAIRLVGYDVYIYDNRFVDLETAQTDVAGVQYCYELATPVTIQLTPTEIKTVLGVNYVWGDCGGNTSIVCYDGNVEHLDDLRDTYDSVNRPDAPTLIAGNTAFNYSALMSNSETIPQNMFNGCTAVQNVESPYVTTVGANAFAGATKLKYISLPNCTQVGAAAFSCQRTVSADKAYVKIDLPKCTTMGTRAFYKFGATDATAELEFPELTQIGSDCFSADGASTAFTIKSIKLPKLAEAGSTAFQRMTAETIDIGDTCTQLNTTPLAYATVTNFICRATTPPALGSSAGLGGTNMTLTNIYVPDAALSDYMDNTNYPRWAKHSALMHPLSDIEPTT